MAEALSVNNTAGKLSCSICKKTLQEMTLSSCFHTFCKDCLLAHFRSMPTKTHYVCPICKTTINIPLDILQEPSYKLGAGEYKYGESKFINDYCDICRDNKMAVNRCLQCDESFCENCTNAHLGMKVSKYHSQRVVPLHRLGMLGIGVQSSDLSQKYCLRHRNEEIIVVCKECNVVLCLICKLLEHENHVTKLVSEEATEVRRNLSSLLDQQMGYSENLQLQIKMAVDRKVRYPCDLEQELTKVRYQTTKLHQEVEKNKALYEKELVQHYGGHIQRNGENLQDLKQEYETYVQASKEAQDILDSDNDVLAVRKGTGVYNTLSKIEMDSATGLGQADSPRKQFAAGNVDESSLQNMLGSINQLSASVRNVKGMAPKTPTSANQRSIQNSAMPRLSSPTKLTGKGHDRVSTRHLSVFNLLSIDGVGYVYGIAPAGNQQAWVTMLDHSHVTLVDKDGRQVRKVDVGEPCDGVASDGHKGCFVTCPITKCVKHVKQSGEIITIIDELLQVPHGIASLMFHDADSNSTVEELYICFTESKRNPMSLDNQQGCVKVFSFDGEDLMKDMSFMSPVRVATSAYGRLISVSDHTNGCVTILDRASRSVQALYTGRSEIEQVVFQPLGVCFDKNGYVIMADWKSGAVTRIRPNGSWVQDLAVELTGPQTVAVGGDRLLWIGSKYGHIDVYEIEG